jgi:hypothetical protein
MPTLTKPSAPKKLAKRTAPDPAIAEILKMAEEIQKHLRQGCSLAIRVGIRLMHIHTATGESEEPGGFRAALEALDGVDIPRSTAYRWINAASAAVMRLQSIEDPSLIELPKPGSKSWEALEKKLADFTRQCCTSIR